MLTASRLRDCSQLFAILALPCVALVAATSAAQSCDGDSKDPQVVGGIACPDGQAATVMPADTEVPTPALIGPTTEFNPERAASVEVPHEAGSGSRFFVAWSGPGNQGDYVAIALPNSPGGQYANYSYAQDESPLSLTAPDAAGEYEVRYVDSRSRDILASASIVVTEALATIDLAEDVGSGSSFEVLWSGPGNQGDYIAIAVPGTSGNEYRNYSYAQQESPLMLRAPDEPGSYEVRYVQNQSRTILASQPVTVTAVSATLSAAATVNSGASFEVTWSGPANQADYIAIAVPGTSGSQYRNYTYVQEGSPLDLLAPDEPGNYEIRYVQTQSRTILTTLPIEILPVSATLEIPAEVKAGEPIDVTWTGPANQSDYIAIAEVGAPGSAYQSYAYIERGSPLQLTAPPQAGTWEVRYIQRQSRTVLVSKTIRIVE